jgi:glycerophosphoryl diester phosphodiesterase
MPSFDLQGHRGARGLRPENTLPSFEAAFDSLVTSIETDLHLTRDGIVVLCHDPYVSPHLFAMDQLPLPVSRLELAQLQQFKANRNPDPARFPRQDTAVTPVAAAFARARGVDPHSVPTLEDLFAFATDYAGELGNAAGKTAEQRSRAARVRFDLELKRVPFFPEAIGDRFEGSAPGELERRVVETTRAAGMVARTNVRSFHHRSVAHLLRLEPGLTGAALMADTAPVDPAAVAQAVGAAIYCPAYQFVDQDLVQRAHAAGVRVVPWTVNDPDHWRRLLDWDVDGITTDFPDALAAELRIRGLNF